MKTYSQSSSGRKNLIASNSPDNSPTLANTLGGCAVLGAIGTVIATAAGVAAEYAGYPVLETIKGAVESVVPQAQGALQHGGDQALAAVIHHGGPLVDQAMALASQAPHIVNSLGI